MFPCHSSIHTYLQLVAGIYVESLSNDMKNISIISDAFEQYISNDKSNIERVERSVVEGLLTGQSKALKRPTFSRGGSTSGELGRL